MITLSCYLYYLSIYLNITSFKTDILKSVRLKTIGIKVITHNNKFFIIILGLIAALPPLSMYIYLPSVLNIAQNLQTTTSEINQTTSLFMLGLCLGLLIWGTLSDRIGRRLSLMIGLFICFIAFILCDFCTNIHQFETLRFIQGFGLSAGSVNSLTILRDCFTGEKLTKNIATIIVVMSLSPMFAPIIGTAILSTFHHWNHIYLFLALFSVLNFMLVYLLKETLIKSNEINSLSQELKNYILHMKNINYMLNSLISGLSFAAYFAYVSISSVMITKVFHFSNGFYSLCMSINIVGLIIGNMLIKSFVSSSKSKEKLMKLGLYASIIGIFIYMYSSYQVMNLYGLITGMFLLTFGTSMISTLSTSTALNFVQKSFAAANSLNSFLRFGLASLSAFIVNQYMGQMLIKFLPLEHLAIILFMIILYLIARFRNNPNHNEPSLN